MRIFQKIIKYAAFLLAATIVLSFIFFFVGKSRPAADIRWGVNFSYSHAEELGLDWQETYLTFLDELGVKRFKLITQWDLLEPSPGKFDFEAVDWQLREAEKRGARAFLVLGMKTPRYPECHIPGWAANFSQKEREAAVLNFLEASIKHFKETPTIWAWQIENEPLFPFGECPEMRKEFWREEINLVKSLDPARPVIATDSGEWSLWFQAARVGDIVGTTLYRKVWFKELDIYTPYPLPPVFYGRKAWLVKFLFGKDVINVELQAEPWGPTLLYDLPLEEQDKTMNLERFKKIISYAKNTGMSEFYFWGAEWWHWLKEADNNSAIWEEAKKLF
ncbi:MAG: hypothetical protein UY26_C0002G0096 [Candidatus Jorgensenbacteria bacterium GW2011_GWA1_48_13]|uniref:Glycoside hydrolase family 42 N-terminal domain-containing protein n=2 Tax=Candidatus Joergenseniibacteriota TaxID=1752739 RepID=A0A0G1W9Y1_9BACT|nr:MAG: hypothetical protein UY26_C0002G0096 [Candidatus Jorgensenbacteria bacterium GW2011_GWA1_48_13]KKU99220.1 MAG: hypothetical protein UY32_C0004G0012 [Candidatus Jorgensenbacteria bacterium GW2011_GWC1_48_8]KKW15415.1 MAG: hypothetical protein UY55_C0001G0169 [Candidatus Jorgensenbacteria bacterium GW2011_GWB1_50_10]